MKNEVKEYQNSVQFEIVKDPNIAGRRLVADIIGRSGFTDAELKVHIRATKKMENALNSKQFKDKMLARNIFVSSNKTGKQVYEKMMTGVEVLRPEKDYAFDVKVTIYEKNNSTVGYTYPSEIDTYVNRKFFRMYSDGEIASNMCHEWLHKQGHGHTSNYTPERKDSVPYWVGYTVRELVDGVDAGKIDLIDLYPLNGTPAPQEPAEIPEIPIEVPDKTLVKVCGWGRKWGFIPWYSCWEEYK